MPDNSVKSTIILAVIGATLGLAIGGFGGMFVGAGVMYVFSIIFHIIQDQVERSNEAKGEKELKDGKVLLEKLMGATKEEVEPQKEVFHFGQMLEMTPEEQMAIELSVREYERRAKKK